MIQLLSFDIGIKNMAYCYSIINNNDLNIITVNKVDLNCNKNNIQNIIDNTIDFLDIIFNDLNIDTNEKIIILIECQMTSIMRTIQTCINTYFKVISKHQNIDIETIYVSAKHKLKIMDIYTDTIMNDKYKQNKLDAIYYTTHLLTTTFKNDNILNIINSYKKKDDICDAFLMCVYYYISNI